ncbi:hypothetical protein ACFL96_12755 [Thermoproteota archaeon]
MLSTSLTDDFGTISMGSDYLGLTHSSGLWKMQGENGAAEITQLATESNSYQTKINVVAATGVTSSTTLYWPSTLTFPQDIDFNSERVEEVSYYEVRADFDSYSGGPAVFLDETNGYVIAKAEHSSDIIITLYFSAASSSPPSTSPPSSSVGVPTYDDDVSDEDREPIQLGVDAVITTTTQADIRTVPIQTEWVTPILVISFVGVGLLSIIPLKKRYDQATKPVTKKIDNRFASTTKNLKNKIKERWD